MNLKTSALVLLSFLVLWGSVMGGTLYFGAQPSIDWAYVQCPASSHLGPLERCKLQVSADGTSVVVPAN